MFFVFSCCAFRLWDISQHLLARPTSLLQSGPKKCIHSLLINIFGINLNEISISG